MSFYRMPKDNLLTKYFSLTYSFYLVLQVEVNSETYRGANNSVKWLHKGEGKIVISSLCHICVFCYFSLRLYGYLMHYTFKD